MLALSESSCKSGLAIFQCLPFCRLGKSTDKSVIYCPIIPYVPMKTLLRTLTCLIASLILCRCEQPEGQAKKPPTYPDVRVAGAMKNVMWKGELGGVITLDTLADGKGMYGLGPVSYLTGELLLMDGKAYVSRVVSDSTMVVEQTAAISAPFFVYAQVTEWQETQLPDSLKTIRNLEAYLDQVTKESKRPYVFKLRGTVSEAAIHIQNLPEGTAVSSPAEAHQGQTNYGLQDVEVEIIGFFSTEHKGIFTHHDSYLHMHLITADEKQMGHLDEVSFGDMQLYLPVK